MKTRAKLKTKLAESTEIWCGWEGDHWKQATVYLQETYYERREDTILI